MSPTERHLRPRQSWMFTDMRKRRILTLIYLNDGLITNICVRVSRSKSTAILTNLLVKVVDPVFVFVKSVLG